MDDPERLEARDRLRAWDLMQALGARQENARWWWTRHANPMPMPRPRVTSKRTFTPAKAQAEKEALAALWAAKGPREQLRGAVILVAIFHRRDRRRVDLDNLLKLVMDAGTDAGVWRDDSQVRSIACELDYSDQARTTCGIAQGVS